MLARTRLISISLFSVLLLAAACFPAAAQIHGVPPSVTSFGFGGSNNPAPGIPASVTSLGPLGFNCCSRPFIPPFNGSGFQFHQHHWQNHERFPVGEMTPAIIPYFVPYPMPYEDYMGDENNAEVDSTYSRGGPAMYSRGPWYQQVPAPRYAPSEVPSAREKTPPAVEPEPTVEMIPQPATVLVYKDGHKMEVQNYAILGDTLFDFEGNRSHKIQLADLELAATQKTNDERGIEFRIPGEKAPER